jgi:hypothetical protein
MINDIRIIGIADALVSLRPGAQWALNGNSYSELVWLDKDQTKPSELEIITEVHRLKEDYDAKEYQRKRLSNYPSIGDQLDMLWHAIDSGTLDTSSDFYTAIKAVKDANPKN